MHALTLALALVAAAGPADLPAAPPAAPAGSFLLTPKAGLLLAPSGLGAALAGALEVGYLTPLLDGRLAVALEAGFAQPGKSGAVSDPRLAAGVDGSYQLTLRQLTLALSAVYRFERAWRELTPYAGLGPTVTFDRARTVAFGATTDETAGRIGALAQVGAEWPLGPGAALLEARYHLTRVVFVSTGNASAGGFGLLGGYRFRF